MTTGDFADLVKKMRDAQEVLLSREKRIKEEREPSLFE